jgi:hypothetical protein
MSLQHAEDSPIVTERETLTLMHDRAQSLPSFASTDPDPKPLPAFGEHAQDLIPHALPATWARSDSSA